MRVCWNIDLTFSFFFPSNFLLRTSLNSQTHTYLLDINGCLEFSCCAGRTLGDPDKGIVL